MTIESCYSVKTCAMTNIWQWEERKILGCPGRFYSGRNLGRQDNSLSLPGVISVLWILRTEYKYVTSTLLKSIKWQSLKTYRIPSILGILKHKIERMLRGQRKRKRDKDREKAQFSNDVKLLSSNYCLIDNDIVKLPFY